jgi:hypothetical protein
MLMRLLNLISRRRSDFPNFSVRIEKVFREAVYVVYREHDRDVKFSGELIGEKWEEINVEVTKGLPEEDLSRIVPNLAAGLAKLGYKYSIFRKGELQPIPEDERLSAIGELRQMGIDVEISADRNQIKTTPRPDWRRPSQEGAKAMAARMIELTQTARGIRATIEILARSEP